MGKKRLKINGYEDWKNLYRSGNLPSNIPAAPDSAYKNKGWEGWGSFLGTGNIANFNKEFLPFKEAREFVRSLDIKGLVQWREYCLSGEKPNNIPSAPDQIYKGDPNWKGLGDFFGNGNNTKGHFLSYQKAKSFVRKLKLNNVKEWKLYVKSGEKPLDIPSWPNEHYSSKGWKGWGEFLGTGNVSNQKREYRTFAKARAFVRSLGLRNVKEWGKYFKSGKRPDDIPSHPSAVYKDKGWKGMGDWLGTGRIADHYREYLPFKKARAFVRKLGLKSRKEWDDYCRSGEKPDNIPHHAWRTYEHSGWKSMGDWLGTGRVKNGDIKYLPFRKARAYVRKLGLKSQKEWRRYCKSGKKPNNIPSHVNEIYKEWISWPDWLGTKNGKI